MTQPASDTSNTRTSQALLSPPKPQPDFSPLAQAVRKLKWIVTLTYVFVTQLVSSLAQLLSSLSGFWNQYQQLVKSVGLIVGAIIVLRLAWAVIDALNDIPLVAPTLQLVGIGYSVWFIYRYLLSPSTRIELVQKTQGLLNQQAEDVITTNETK